jgi:hypothetical protein
MEPAVTDQPDYSFSDPSPDADGLGTASPLDALREAYEEPLDSRKTLRIPALPGFAIEVATELPWEDYDRFNKICTNKRGHTDNLKLSSLVVAAQTRTILHDGEPWTIDGKPVTFSSQLLWNQLQDLGRRVTSAGEAAIALFRRDSDLLAVGGDIVEEAGYLDDAEEDTAGPTSG